MGLQTIAVALISKCNSQTEHESGQMTAVLRFAYFRRFYTVAVTLKEILERCVFQWIFDFELVCVHNSFFLFAVFCTKSFIV